MKTEIWSDVVCPFCYIGKRNLENALQQFEYKDKVEIVWHSFELDLNARPEPGTDMLERLATKYGKTREWAEANTNRIVSYAASVGLAFDMDRVIYANSFDAHRLIHLANAHKLQDEAEEKLFSAYLVEGKDIGNLGTLRQIAADMGLDTAEVSAMLEGKTYTNEVRADEREAQQLGIRGVPFFLFNRKYSVSGAQPADLLLEVLQKVWDEETVVTSPHKNAEDNQCDDGIRNI